MFMALAHHRTHKNQKITFEHRDYLIRIYGESSPYFVIKKSTQCGISEYLIITVIAKAISGRQIFYVLPTWGLMNRFVKNRFDKTIMNTALYGAAMIAEMRKRVGLGYMGGGMSISLKSFGVGSIAFVGSGSSAVFTEYPADDFIVDELDECDQANLEMGIERLSASEDRRQIRVGNPTIEGIGIDAEFAHSDMKEWYIRNHCGHWIKPDWFQHVVEKVDENNFILRDQKWERHSKRDLNMICDKCSKPIDRYSPGGWVKENPGAVVSGYHVSKMFSTAMAMREILDRFERGLVNDEAFQRFYNGDLGEAFTSAGAKITVEALNECVRSYRMAKPLSGRCLMGVDVGNMLNVIIGQLSATDNMVRILYIGTVPDFKDLAELHKEYRVVAGVIDALPETRLARRVTQRLRGMFRCYYGQMRRDIINPKARMVTVERTQALDQTKEAVTIQEVELPQNAASVPQFYDQMTAAVRLYNKDAGLYIWEEGSKPDHYHHAMTYMLIARRVLRSLGR